MQILNNFAQKELGKPVFGGRILMKSSNRNNNIDASMWQNLPEEIDLLLQFSLLFILSFFGSFLGSLFSLFAEMLLRAHVSSCVVWPNYKRANDAVRFHHNSAQEQQNRNS